MADPVSKLEQIRELLAQRILVLDGAMGTMIQAHGLGEADYRGERFADHPRDLKGNNDLLSLTRPDVIEEIHRQYLEAGADIVETNTFNAHAISLADYGLEALVDEINLAAARAGAAGGGRVPWRTTRRAPRFVAGALGPTNRTRFARRGRQRSRRPRASPSTSSSRRTTSRSAGLLDGRRRPAARRDHLRHAERRRRRCSPSRSSSTRRGSELPVMVSVTITDRSGRTLSGQTVEAFWNSVSHAPLLSVGINCALGAKQMRPYVEELSQHRAGLRELLPERRPAERASAGSTRRRRRMARGPRASSRASGWLNIVGGCCGTTPAHIRRDRGGGRAACAARAARRPSRYLRLSGLEPLTLQPRRRTS